VAQSVHKKTGLGIKTICRILKLNRSGYYAWLKRPASRRFQENTQLIEKIKALHIKSRGIYGAPRLTKQLRLDGYSCGEKRVANLMKKEGIFGCAKKKFKPMTTLSDHDHPISPRIFKTGKKEALPTGSNQVWVGDITFIPTAEGWLYLSTLLDVFNRKIVGYSLEGHLKAELVWEATKNAICHQKNALIPGSSPLLVHSDRGCQYASSYYREKLELLGITQSMSRRGNCYDNAFAESFFHTLKVELVHRKDFQTRQEASAAIQEYIEWYNTERLHSSLGYKAPCEYEKMVLAA
jgi:putative transposase